MRNLKRLLAVIVVLTMVLTFAIPAFAAGELKADTKTCGDIGMLQGTGSGVTAEYGATTPLRYQAAILYLRLKGLEGAAKAWLGTENFGDVSKMSADNQAIMAYLKAHPDLGWQGDGKNFNPMAPITAQEYYKVILTALGYTQKDAAGVGDFAYADVLTFAKDTAKLAVAGNVASFTIDTLATATVEALKATPKAGTTTLAADLVAKGVLDGAKAEAAGLYTSATTATAAATGAKILTVTFSKAVDSAKATFAVSKGSIAINTASTAWNDAKTVATITLATKLTAGDYTVKVSGVTTDALSLAIAGVKDETVTKIEFASTTGALVRGSSAKTITVGYKVSNQYGEDMTSSANAPTISVSKGAGVATNSTSVITIDNTGTSSPKTDVAYAAGDKVTVSALDSGSGVFATTVLTVGDVAKVADIAVTKLYNANSATLQVGMSEAIGNFKLVIDAKDQYGNAITSDAAVQADTIVTVSSTSVANVHRVATVPTFGTTSISGTNTVTLALEGAITAGTSTVTIISTTTGHMAKFDVVVKDAAKVDTLTLTAPDVAVAGEDITIPFSAVDQFGTAVTDAAKLTSGITSINSTIGAGTIEFVQDYVKGKANLVLHAGSVTAAQTVVITAVTGTSKVVQFTVSLKDPAVPSVVTGVDYTKNYEVNGTTTVDASDIKVNDQYGRSITPTMGATASTYRYVISSSDTGIVSVTPSNGILTSGSVVLTAVAKGSATITVSLQKGDGTAVSNSDYQYSSVVVDKAAITSYTLDDIGTILADDTSAHDVAVTVNGVLADGTKVVVPDGQGYYTVTIANNHSNHITYVGGKVHADKTGLTADDTTANTATATVVVAVNAAGSPVLTKTITISLGTRSYDKIALKDAGSYSSTGAAWTTGAKYTVEDAAGLLASADHAIIATDAAVKTAVLAVLKVTDQSGVDYAFTDVSASDVTVYVTNLSIANSSGLLTDIAAGDSFNAVVVMSNGKILTIKFVAK